MAFRVVSSFWFTVCVCCVSLLLCIINTKWVNRGRCASDRVKALEKLSAFVDHMTESDAVRAFVLPHDSWVHYKFLWCIRCVHSFGWPHTKPPDIICVWFVFRFSRAVNEKTNTPISKLLRKWKIHWMHTASANANEWMPFATLDEFNCVLFSLHHPLAQTPAV